ncbi:MAG: HypC/HybG/HupF family hydrogenase formation chaperone, partial [Solirubrobacteraceae bacterium]
EVAGGHEQVALDLVEDVQLGELLLCHAGIALERMETG